MLEIRTPLVPVASGYQCKSSTSTSRLLAATSAVCIAFKNDAWKFKIVSLMVGSVGCPCKLTYPSQP